MPFYICVQKGSSFFQKADFDWRNLAGNRSLLWVYVYIMKGGKKLQIHVAEDGIGYVGVGRGCGIGMILPPNSNKPSLILHMANCILWFFVGGKQEITILLIKGDKKDWSGMRGTHRSEGNTKEEGSESQKSRASMIPRGVKSSQ